MPDTIVQALASVVVECGHLAWWQNQPSGEESKSMQWARDRISWNRPTGQQDSKGPGRDLKGTSHPALRANRI